MESLSAKTTSNPTPTPSPTPTADPEPTSSGFSGSTYSEAVAYLKKNGIDNGTASGIRTQDEFRRWSGKSEFDSYADYLAFQTKYLIENKGKSGRTHGGTGGSLN